MNSSSPPAPLDAPAQATTDTRQRLSVVAAFVLASLLAGAIDGLVTGKAPSAAIVLSGASLAAITGLLLGLAAWAISTLVAGVSRKLDGLRRMGAWLASPFVRSDEPAFRDAWIVAYGSLVALVVVVGLGFAVQRVLNAVLFGLQELKLAQQLSTMITSGLFVVLFVLHRALTSGVARLLRRIEAKRRIPLPPPVGLVWAVFFTLPGYAVLFPLLRTYGGMLGRLRDLAALGLLAVVAVQLLTLSPRLARRAAAALDLLVVVLGLVAILSTAKPRGARKQAQSRAESGAVAGLGARVARAITDLDRDGASAYFGGADCAPTDPTRAPGKKEVAGNGVDEDCDGKDGFLDVTLGVRNRFSDSLEPEQVGAYNVVWVIMETVRADHVSALGYDKPTMPYLEELAKESLLFENATSQASATVLSIPSMLTGVDPGAITWKRLRSHPQVDEATPMLAERLKKRRYKTAFVYDNYIKNAFLSIQRGFDTLLLAEPDNQNKNNRPRRNLISTAKAAEFVGKLAPNDPFFMVVYYPDQHSPYTRQPDVDTSAFSKDELGDYDTELRFADEQLRALVEMLKARPKIWERTIVIINADHGEEFGEHDGMRHARTCYAESVHVPLLVRIPGIPAQRIKQRVGLIDVVPTVLELVGATDGTEKLSGQSLLVPALTPEKVDGDRPIFCNIGSITDKYGTFFRRAVRNDQFTLTLDARTGQYGLFDHRDDPFEQIDLGMDGMYAAQAQRLKAELEASLTGNLSDHETMDEKLGIPKPSKAPKPKGGKAP